jgi:hypothetical protein
MQARRSGLTGFSSLSDGVLTYHGPEHGAQQLPQGFGSFVSHIGVVPNLVGVVRFHAALSNQLAGSRINMSAREER